MGVMDSSKKMAEPFDCAIISVPEFDPNRSDYPSYLKQMDRLWVSVFESLNSGGTLWVLSSNVYVNNELLPVPLDIEERIKAVTDFKTKNILVVYNENRDVKKPFSSVYYDILFFVKSLDEYYFDKDAIREPHVFKDIEWGKRKFGSSGYNNKINVRYSEKGKDPGNVFYKTERNADGKILRIYEYRRSEMIEKIVKLSTKKGDIVASNIIDQDFRRMLDALGRKIVQVGEVVHYKIA